MWFIEIIYLIIRFNFEHSDLLNQFFFLVVHLSPRIFNYSSFQLFVRAPVVV